MKQKVKAMRICYVSSSQVKAGARSKDSLPK